MKTKYILFDLDGTLMNTLADLRNSINPILETYGFPLLNDEEVKAKLGHGFQNAIRSILPEESRDELFEEALNMFIYYYDMNYFMESKPYPGIPELLKELHENGCRLAVYSNKAEHYTKKLIAMHFKDIPFDEVWGAVEEYPIKPDPKRGEELIAAKGLDRDDMYMVGDSGTDRQAATNLGIHSVLVTWGYRSEEKLLESGPEYLAHDVSELRKILLGE
ncbi:MAG: HAD family hydrolase [Erysipelotrichaceae bacterium]|jgi:phosphoglycolate phosphatase|nr:HAD family hydrolase [Erysipelotrichaceae bacterium]